MPKNASKSRQAKLFIMNLNWIGITVLLGFIMCGCSADEPKYSCNPEVNKWVEDHLDEIHSMTRAEWLECDAEISTSIYRAFTPKQRTNFWREKFQELKTLEWTKVELCHIREVEDFFENHLSWFYDDSLTDQQFDEAELFVYKWSERAKREFGWSDHLIGMMIASGDRLLDTEGTSYQTNASAGNVLLSSDESCNCNRNSSVTCSWNVTCEKASCNDLSKGCGFFLLYECNGRCEEPRYKL